MANFYENLRASKSGSRQISNNLPTRGDMQKERQKRTSVDPNAFINFLRIATGAVPAYKGKEQLSIEDAPAHNIDKMSPEDDEIFRGKKMANYDYANNGTMKVENNLDKYNAAVNGTTDVPYAHSDFEDAYGVLNNYNELNKVLDEYDAINTWTGKQQFLRNAYKRFEDRYGDIGKWFDRLYGYTLEARNFGERDTKAVTNVMRQINENVKNRFLKEV